MTTISQLAFVFPGQGSQSKGMLADLAKDFQIILSTFEEASTALAYDLWSLVQENEEKLNQTTYTQPALLAAGVALWRVWQETMSFQPSLLAGHSLGEYTALVCANSLPFSDAVKLVATRGQLMQSAVPTGTGAMAAILGLSGEAVLEVCEQTEGLVQAANFNSLEQTVIAGETAAVEAAMVIAKDKGAKRALKLPVSVPSHCELMRPAAEAFKSHLSAIDFKTPQIPVLRNVDAAPHTDAEKIREALSEQLYSSVQWVKTVNALSENHVQQVIECGPGAVLSGLIKRIDRNIQIESLQTPPAFEKAVALVKAANA